MDLRNEPLQSGVSYSLYEFFGPKRDIVIPDLQRDYCWASTIIVTGDGQTLVEAYVDDLILASQKEEDAQLKMGLLYGYEYPADNVQLCDGQQRLTTLFASTNLGMMIMFYAKKLTVLSRIKTHQGYNMRYVIVHYHLSTTSYKMGLSTRE